MAVPIKAIPIAPYDDDDDGSGVRLYQSIYETAMRNKVPMPVIDDMIKIYSYDVDFQRKVLWFGGLGNETYLPPWLGNYPQTTSMEKAKLEFDLVVVRACT